MNMKIIAIFIISLFIGTSVIPSLSSTDMNDLINIQEIIRELPSNSNSLNYVIMDESSFGDQLDQQQTQDDNLIFFNCEPNVASSAQSFVPSFNVLTRVELKLTKEEDLNILHGDFKISIRYNLCSSGDLTSVSMSSEDVDLFPSENWYMFNFPNIYVIPGHKYYIVFRASNDVDFDPGTQKGSAIGWYYSISNPYPNGEQWYRSNGNWIKRLDADMTFKTYGYDSEGDVNNPPQVVITYPHNGDTVFSNITINGTAFDSDGYVQNVKVNTGSEWKTASGTISWTYDWDTTNLDDGDYCIKAVATDNKSWPSETALIYITVDNSGNDNSPPNKPSDPDPANHSINVDINTNLSWTGGDLDSGDIVTYDVYFGSMLPIQKMASNITIPTYDPETLIYDLTYFWNVVAWDNHGASTVGPGWYLTTINPHNNPPNKPSKPSGQIKGKIGQNYSYTTTTTDPDGDQLYYNWSWGDNTFSGWIGLYYSGENVNESHSWIKKGNYNIKVKAKDILGTESNWSDTLAFRMPKSYICNQIIQLPMKMMERFSFFEKILNQVL